MDQLAYLLGLEVVRAALFATMLIAASFWIMSLRRRRKAEGAPFSTLPQQRSASGSPGQPVPEVRS
jgi:hypothetical protein